MNFSWSVQLDIPRVSVANCWDIELSSQREISYLQATMYYFFYCPARDFGRNPWRRHCSLRLYRVTVIECYISCMPEKKSRFARTRHARNKWVMMTFFTPRGRKGTKLSHDKDNPLVWLRVAEQLHLAINLSVEEQARTKIFREAIRQTQTSVERSKESVCNQQVLLGNVEGRHYLQGKRSVF